MDTNTLIWILYGQVEISLREWSEIKAKKGANMRLWTEIRQEYRFWQIWGFEPQGSFVILYREDDMDGVALSRYGSLDEAQKDLRLEGFDLEGAALWGDFFGVDFRGISLVGKDTRGAEGLPPAE